MKAFFADDILFFLAVARLNGEFFLPAAAGILQAKTKNIANHDVDPARAEPNERKKSRPPIGDLLFFGSPVEAIFEIERIPEASSSAKVIVFVPLL